MGIILLPIYLVLLTYGFVGLCLSVWHIAGSNERNKFLGALGLIGLSAFIGLLLVVTCHLFFFGQRVYAYGLHFIVLLGCSSICFVSYLIFCKDKHNRKRPLGYACRGAILFVPVFSLLMWQPLTSFFQITSYY
jgi:hypothetical protein